MPEKNKCPLFITLEGTEGVGKSSGLLFLEQYFKERSFNFIVTREPGGTTVAESIRSVLLSHHEEPIHPDTELLLMFASRAQHIHRVIKPALLQGKVVVCDRFTDASYAYQGGGRGISSDRIAILEELVHPGLQPDLTILFDAPVKVGLDRLADRTDKDRIEQERIEFFERVRTVYLERALQHPERFKIVDATMPLEQVQAGIQKLIEEFLAQAV